MTFSLMLLLDKILSAGPAMLYVACTWASAIAALLAWRAASRSRFGKAARWAGFAGFLQLVAGVCAVLLAQEAGVAPWSAPRVLAALAIALAGLLLSAICAARAAGRRGIEARS